MFITVLFMVAKTWKQPTCPSVDDWLKKWYTYTVEYYSAIRKDEIPSFVTSWMDLESSMLSKINGTEKDKNHMTSDVSGI